jgi:hypothetical protein
MIDQRPANQFSVRLDCKVYRTTELPLCSAQYPGVIGSIRKQKLDIRFSPNALEQSIGLLDAVLMSRSIRALQFSQQDFDGRLLRTNDVPIEVSRQPRPASDLACLRLFTFFFDRPLRSVPVLRSCKARFTFLPALFPYRAIDHLRG